MSSAAVPAGMVKLVSAEGFEFVVDQEAASVSNTIKNMLSSGGLGVGGGAHPVRRWRQRAALASRASNSHTHAGTGTFIESEQGEIRFPEISTAVLEKVCQYFYYRLKYANT